MTGTPAGIHVVGTGSGRRRAQIVLTVGNLDTGQIASTSLVPGGFTPVPTPNGGWWLPFRPIVTGLAAQAGVAAATLHDPDFPDERGRLPAAGINLPRQWQPELPVGQRHQLEAAAIAERVTAPWLVLLGRSTEPAPPEHARLLGRLCMLADQLHVDLVIEARPATAAASASATAGAGLTWDIRFELPGGQVPDYPHRRAADLPAAIATVTAEQAASGLDSAGPDVPAYFLADAALTPRPATVGLAGYPGGHDIDQLERRIVADADAEQPSVTEQLSATGQPAGTEPRCGAQAIWRNRQWWHTSLRPGDTAGAFRRGWEPPAPDYWGESIPTRPCVRCRDANDPPYCVDCYGTRQIRRGAVLTVTDLRGRTVHRNWRPDQEDPQPAATLIGTDSPGGPTGWRLPEHYRVGLLAAEFGVQPVDLTDLDGETVVEQHLRDGVSHLAPDGGDPVGTFLAEVVATHHAARLLVRANDWAGPSLDDLARIVVGVGLALDVTVVDHRRNLARPDLPQGEGWQVAVVGPAAAVAVDQAPTCASLPEAVALCLRYLSGALRATIPKIPDRPIPVPQQLASAGPALDTSSFISEVRRLAARHPGRPTTIRLGATWPPHPNEPTGQQWWG
ncbi:hypothetical protein [Micromonospora sp. NBC_01813]|uniref:hypothetical protein n=1 Tax=Micromonospora sp. NBC_01813 TaxID=2975988 RepID=UPI002DD96757|nr:hypothetical protein [Micromonospora sp. NBC_01813]WSA08277.1 hypothetical protein OG958_29440 [Micromonospora sp. NBC_01813]